MSDSHLTPVERRALFGALMSAFPTRGALEMFTRLWLDQNLEAITGKGTGQEVTVELITWAEQHGRVLDVVTGAQRAVPGNVMLADFVKTWRPVEPAAAPPAPDGPLDLAPKIFVRESSAQQRQRRVLIVWALVLCGLLLNGWLLAAEVFHPGAERQVLVLGALFGILGFVWWRATEEVSTQIRWMGPITTATETIRLGPLAQLFAGAVVVKALGLALAVAPVTYVVTRQVLVTPPPSQPFRSTTVEPIDASLDATRDVARGDLPLDASAADVRDAEDQALDGPRAVVRSRAVVGDRRVGLPGFGERCAPGTSCREGWCERGRCLRLRGDQCQTLFDCYSQRCVAHRCGLSDLGAACRAHGDCEDGLGCANGHCFYVCHEGLSRLYPNCVDTEGDSVVMTAEWQARHGHDGGSSGHD